MQRSRGNNENRQHQAALKAAARSGGAAHAATAAADCKNGPEKSALPLAMLAKCDLDQAAEEERGYILLHLIRILALYLYVYLSQNPFLVDDLLLQPDTDLIDRASKLEGELHAMLLAYVETEVASNQFDGLVQEKRVFLAIKKLFRDQKVQAVTQCKTLVALLSTYLSQLQSPIVHCEPFSMLLSTLEYLAKESKKDVALRMLYPIVNAIDSLTVEQRECLDALTTLWKWVAACDPSEMILAKIVNRHHTAIIQIDASGTSAAASKQLPTNVIELGACFVTTLLHHSDHIFRHDPEQFSDLQTPLESDTEDEESGEDAVCAQPVEAQREAVPAKATTPTLPPLTAAEVQVNTPSPPKTVASSKGSSKSMRRRKKHEDKLVVVDGTASAKQQQQIKKDGLDDSNPAEAGSDQDGEKSLPAVVCVGIAAAAGTIAAALCVIFT